MEFQKSCIFKIKREGVWHDWSWQLSVVYLKFTSHYTPLVHVDDFYSLRQSPILYKQRRPQIILRGWSRNLATGTWNNNATVTAFSPLTSLRRSGMGWRGACLFFLGHSLTSWVAGGVLIIWLRFWGPGLVLTASVIFYRILLRVADPLILTIKLFVWRKKNRLSGWRRPGLIKGCIPGE